MKLFFDILDIFPEVGESLEIGVVQYSFEFVVLVFGHFHGAYSSACCLYNFDIVHVLIVWEHVVYKFFVCHNSITIMLFEFVFVPLLDEVADENCTTVEQIEILNPVDDGL